MLTVKQMQSEVGAVGEPGPNAELVLGVGNILGGQFRRDSDSDTLNDAFIILSQYRAGKKINGEKCMGVSRQFNGTSADLCDLIISALKDRPELIPIFQTAINYVKNGTT